MHIKRWLVAAAAGGAATLGVATVGLPAASAATTPIFNGSTGVAGYGWDGNAHLIVQGGSDTIYKVENSLTSLYNTYAQNNFCQTSKTVVAVPALPTYPQTTPILNQCNAQTTPAWDGGNYQADTVAEAYPAGSTAGIASVNAQTAATGFNVANPGEVVPYEGTNQTISDSASTRDNGFGAVDFARSSRPPVTSGSSTCNVTYDGTANNELGCDTFWGFAEDGIQVITLRGIGTTCSATQATNCSLPSTAKLNAADLLNIWDGTDTMWSQVADLGITAGSPQDGPIVPWAMNTASGTYATMNSYILDEAVNEGATIPSGWTGVDSTVAGDTTLINGAANPQNVRSLANPALGGNLGSNNKNPFENDMKPLFTDSSSFADDRPAEAGVAQDAAGLSTANTSTQNPYNWIWFGSFGLMHAFAYQGSPTLSLTYQSGLAIAPPTQPQANPSAAIPIQAVGATTATAPNATTIGLGTYPIGRTLFQVTLKTDADCPLNTTTEVCDFTANAINNPNGTADLNVGTNTIPPTESPVNATFSSAGSTGKGGAVREYTRWLCRTNGENGGALAIDPYSQTAAGTTYAQDISSSLAGSGFTPVPASQKSAGSNCAVFSFSYPAIPPTFH